ncbi:hypothetical protein ABZV65_30450 [Streptomyces bauhiniae]|uniref:hypothetical protein n=1 Tax=Streptomyces bauhiniae TaxID=2340725 RepID=UPI0033BB9127
MFQQTVTQDDRPTSTSTVTEARALAVLRRMAKRRNCRIEVTRTGGAIIEWEAWNGSTVPRKRKAVLEPVTPLGNLTPTVLEALADISTPDGYLVTDAQGPFRPRCDRIVAGLFGGAGPALAAKLIGRGLVTLGAPYEATSNGYMPETRTPVAVSLAARLALFAREHRTRTSEPAGYVKPADVGMAGITAGLNKPGRRAGRIYDGSSAASCTCRNWTGTWERRMFALDAARKHRQDAAAEFIRSL